MLRNATELALEGGDPVRILPWPTYDKGDVFINPEDEEAAMTAVRSHLLFRYDYRPYEETEAGKLEARICSYFGCRHALAVSSGTAAITLGLMAAGVPKGALVACPGFTFAATPSAIVMAGCQPFLVENDANLHFDVEDLRRRWTDDIKAIVVVHMRGLASDMGALMDFADEKGIPVIEDAVPALGAHFNGKKLGTFGKAGAFSTQSDKSINTGEGGFLLTDDSELYARAIVLSGAYEGRMRRHFSDPAEAARQKSDLTQPLLSLRMDEIRAALARSQFDRLHIRLGQFRRNYDYVVDALSGVEGIDLRMPVCDDGYLGECLIFSVPDGADAELFAHALRREGIDARNLGSDRDCNVRCFWNWHFMFDTDDASVIKQQLPRTTRLLEQAIDIPLSSTLTQADCDDLIAATKKVAAGLLLRELEAAQ